MAAVQEPEAQAQPNTEVPCMAKIRFHYRQEFKGACDARTNWQTDTRPILCAISRRKLVADRCQRCLMTAPHGGLTTLPGLQRCSCVRQHAAMTYIFLSELHFKAFFSSTASHFINMHHESLFCDDTFTFFFFLKYLIGCQITATLQHTSQLYGGWFETL